MAVDGGVTESIAAESDLVDRLRAERRVLQHLHRVGVALASAQFDLQSVVQTVTDSATELAGAEFGAFFYNVVDEVGESYMLYTLSGAPAEAFADFPLPRKTPVFAPTFGGLGVERVADITRDPRYGQMPPYHGMPPGHLPVRSYLAVPVMGSDGAVLGGLFLGHGQPGMFDEVSELAVVGIAGHAAAAIESARVFQREQQVALTLQHSLLAEELPSVQGVEFAARYLGATDQVEVGGDWYDAVLLPDGRVGFSVGDVVGHDMRAAATMGKLRSVVRAYLIEGSDPVQVTERLEAFCAATQESTLTTLICGILDPATRTVTLLRAGHPRPLLVPPSGAAHFVAHEGVPPAGAALIDTAQLRSRVETLDLDAGSTLLLYTDGLIERRREPIYAGMDRLLAAASAAPRADPEQLCDHAVRDIGAIDDDVVVFAITVH